MRRTVLVLALAVVVAIGSTAVAPSVAAGSQSEGIVVVAGHGNVGSFAAVTVAAWSIHGRVGGWLRIDNGPGFVFVSEVRCVRPLAAGAALVGGVIVRAANPSLIGHTSLVSVADGGPGRTDSVGIAFSTSGLDACPNFSLSLHPVAPGNFVVRALGGR